MFQPRSDQALPGKPKDGEPAPGKGKDDGATPGKTKDATKAAAPVTLRPAGDLVSPAAK
jgi:hypothetical protein